MKKRYIQNFIIHAFYLIVSFTIFVIYSYFKLPLVYWSQSENKCIKVMIEENECSCKIMDTLKKYNIKVVE